MKVATLQQPLVSPMARLADYAQLFRPRMAVMVLLTVGIGGMLATIGPASPVILHAMIGVALVSSAASALNQYLERDTDALMPRTANRPLPAGRLHPNEVLILGTLLAVIGQAYLFVMVPRPTAAWATLFTLVSYLVFYTPAKRITSLNTLIGAVPGALPPVIGWTAVRGEIDGGAITLFMILFVWQIPHFLAIAWMYKDGYAAAGHRMLPRHDADGSATARQMLHYMLALIPVSLLPMTTLGAGLGYAAGALGLSLVFLLPILQFRKERTESRARSVLHASLLYLPGILVLMLLAHSLPGF